VPAGKCGAMGRGKSTRCVWESHYIPGPPGKSLPLRPPDLDQGRFGGSDNHKTGRRRLAPRGADSVVIQHQVFLEGSTVSVLGVMITGGIGELGEILIEEKILKPEEGF
jgi:hypothetical protein